MKIEFSPPDISEAEIQAVEEVLRSGWITTGSRTRKLESEIAGLCGTERTVCMNSQTACAEMALRLLGIGPGDEVIVPAYTYSATASVVCHVGAKLVLVDCARDSLEMNYDQVSAAINEHTKVIIPVDLAGIPCNYQKIYEIVEEKRKYFHPSNPIQEAFGRIIISADTAHSLGASRHGIPTGSLADFSSFSFHAVKNITTAEGGALTWRKIPGMDSDQVYRQLQLFCLHGQTVNAFDKTRLGSWAYDIVQPWYKHSLTDLAAAIGLSQLHRYPEMLVRRREIICRYYKAFSPLGILTLPHNAPDHQSSGHLYICRIPGITQEQRNAIFAEMAGQGIACNVHYIPLPMLTAYRTMGFHIEDFPNAYASFSNEITLPLHTLLTDEEVDYIISVFSSIVRKYCIYDNKKMG